MSNDIRKTAQELQERIREAAYMMWESAGRQQGMAVEYWLSAEREVMHAMQRATERMMASTRGGGADAQAAEREPARQVEQQSSPRELRPQPEAQPEPQPEEAAQQPAQDEPGRAPDKPASDALEDIEGIGPAFARKLGSAGIRSRTELLRKCGSARGREKTTEKAGVSPKSLLTWVNMADLMRVDGLDGQFAQVLEAAGVDTVSELRNRRPDNLLNTMNQVNAAKKLTRKSASADQVAKWIEGANNLEPMVTH
jgi:predicted flap endonuclease-1-like 5' DNA nuclease